MSDRRSLRSGVCGGVWKRGAAIVAAAVVAGAVSASARHAILIIAPNDFLDELRPLAKFKEASGRPTILLGLKAVYANHSGADEAEQVKRCIADYQATGGVIRFR